jgi:sugar-phosphatase
MSQRVLVAGAIIFDLDGVLANSIAVVEESWRIWAVKQGLDPELVRRMGHGRRTAEIVQTVAPHLDLLAEIELFVEIEQSLLDGVVPIPGALEFVKSLPSHVWGIATSGERVVATARLRKLGFPIPQVLVASEDVERGKPNPEVYLKAAAGLGVEPGLCLVFEDAPPGVAAARAAGMTAVGVLTTVPPAELRDAAELIPDFQGVTAKMIQETPASIQIQMNGLSLRP